MDQQNGILANLTKVAAVKSGPKDRVGLRENIAVEWDSWTPQTPAKTSPQSRRALGQVHEPRTLFNQSAVLLDTKISLKNYRK